MKISVPLMFSRVVEKKALIAASGFFKLYLGGSVCDYERGQSGTEVPQSKGSPRPT